MNRMTRPSLSLISLRTAFRRSSNSPRNLEPAMSAPRSSEITRLSLSVSGTSPRTMRWARPSAMAVLPTPGSPMSTGLFLVRRREDLDDAPDLLVPADDRVEPARARLGGEVAAVLLERLVGALRGWRWSRAGRRAPPGARRGSASRPAPWRSSSCWASPPTSATPRSRCSVDVYSSPRRRASSWARSMTRFARGSSASWPPWMRARRDEDRRDLAAERRQVHAQAPERLGGDPVVRLDEGGEQVLRVEHGALHPLGELLGGDDGLLGLLGEAVELHGSGSRLGAVGRLGSGGGPGIGLVDEVQERASRRPSPRRPAPSAAPRGPSRRGRPVPPSLTLGMPWPVRRKVLPLCVPAGIVSRIRPLRVATGTSAPSSASRSVTGSSRSRSAPRRGYVSCGRTRTVTTTSRPLGPLPDSRTRLPVSTPRGSETS